MILPFFRITLLSIFFLVDIQVWGQKLMPAPRVEVYGKGRFDLKKANILLSKTNSTEEKRVADLFAGYIKNDTDIELITTYAQVENIPVIMIESLHSGSVLPLPGDTVGEDSRESYSLKVTEKTIKIAAKSDAGVFYAFQTLRQLVTAEGDGFYIPEAEISDYPAFAFRGVMMDLSHGGLPTEAEIKRQIDFLARWKVNQYYFYNEVSIEMKGYPLMNYKGQYSQEQVRRIIAYGRERFIDVIPFVNFYSHLHELLRNQKYTKLGIGKYGHDLDPNNPEMKAMLNDWMQQYAALFPSPFIHIGFDETWETERLAEKNAVIQPEKLYVEHLAFVTKSLQAYGKKVMVWTDISKGHPDIISKFPKEVILVVWDYSANFTSIKNWIKPIQKEKLPFFIQPAADGWAHLYPTETSWDNMDLCLKAANEDHALGYITSIWTDAVQPMLRNSWMFMAYGSVICWQNKPVERNDFIARYSQLMYPQVSLQMTQGFKKLSESQVHLRKRLGQTQTRMWINPFLDHNLKETNEHVEDFEKSRLAAELAQEFFMDALTRQSPDSLFIKSMLLNSRLLSFTAMRFLWSKKITDRWNDTILKTGKKDNSWFSDLSENPHGLLMDLLDYTTEIKAEYSEIWRSENSPYRMGTMVGRFDAEYMFWRGLSLKLLDYRDNAEPGLKPVKFNDAFKIQ